MIVLSPRQEDFVFDSHAFINIAEGAVRSGKTFSCLLRFGEYCITGPKGELMILGKTERTVKRNVVGPLKEIYGAKRVRYVQGSGELYFAGRLIHIVGVNDARAEEKIRGSTLAGAYCNELSLFTEEAFNQLTYRCSVARSQIFADTNPDSPYHWLMQKYLQKADGRDVASWKFRLDDNPGLDELTVARLKRLHTGLWYRRNILGDWVQAEGAIYDMFDHDRHVINHTPMIRQWWVGIDYGTRNPTVFLLVGMGFDEQGAPCMFVMDEYRWDSKRDGGRKTDVQYSRDLREWLAKHRVSPDRIFYDPEAAHFGSQLFQDKVRNLMPADNRVIEGIQDVSKLLAAGRLKIHQRCQGLIEEIASYSWDEKAQQRGEDKPLEKADHGPDALRYVINGTRRYWRPLLRIQEAA